MEKHAFFLWDITQFFICPWGSKGILLLVSVYPQLPLLSYPILRVFFYTGRTYVCFFDFLGERSVWFLRKKHFPLLSFPFKQKKSDQLPLLKKPFQKPKNRIILFCSIHILFYYITTTQDNFN